MPTLSPAVKKAISAVLVAAASAGVIALNAHLDSFPPALQGLVGSALVGLAHWLNAWGSHERALETVTKDIQDGKVGPA